MTTRELDKIRTELQHATENATRDVRKPLQNLTQAIERLDEADDDPKQDRLDSMREELSRLETEADDDTRAHIEQAREHLRAFEENREFLEE